MMQRMTKIQAATRLDVSQSTIDRMIQRGELQTEKERHGSRHRVWVLMDDDEGDATADESADNSNLSSDNSHDASSDELSGETDASTEIELAVLRERVKGLEELAEYHRSLLKDSEWRYQQAMEQLGASQKNMETLTRTLPAAHSEEDIAPRWSWWPFRKSPKQLPRI